MSGKPKWHPVVADVLALLVQDGGPTIDEQLSLAGRISALKDSEQSRVVRELAMIRRRLRDAGEESAEALLRGITALAMVAEQCEAVERRVFG